MQGGWHILPTTAPPQNNHRYILHCVHACDGSTVAAALSNHQVKVYDRRTLEPTSTSALAGHSAALTSLCHSPDHASLLASSSEDKTVRLWDVRAKGAAACVAVIPQADEALSCAMGAGTGLLAVGVGNQVDFFDARKTAVTLGRYADAHTDLVIKVLFHPTQPTTLASGSEDGLICMYNTGVAQADEALGCILNAECPVRDLTFFGPQGDGLAALTGSEGTSIWHWPSAQRALHVEDLRQDVGKAGLFAVQYHYDGAEGRDRLLLSLSDVQGQVTVLEVQPGGGIHPVVQLQQGHVGLVRAVDFYQGSYVTGGEDARLCRWANEAGAVGAGPSPTASTSTPHRKMKQKKPQGGNYKPY